jgi:hypothetical protein
MIELKLLLTQDEAKALEYAMLNYAVRLERLRKEDASPVYEREQADLHQAAMKYLAAVA